MALVRHGERRPSRTQASKRPGIAKHFCQGRKPRHQFTIATRLAGNEPSAPHPQIAELDAASPHFGDKPLIILTQSPPKPTAAPEDKAFHGIWTAHHDAMAKLSLRGSNTTIANTGHYIQIDQPATVTAAVRTAISEIRTTLQTP